MRKYVGTRWPLPEDGHSGHGLLTSVPLNKKETSKVFNYYQSVSILLREVNEERGFEK